VTVFVDTSALYALLDADDAEHEAAAAVWPALLDGELRTHSYVVVETMSLAQSRLGLDAVRTLATDIMPVLSVRWVDQRLHDSATTALLAASRRGLSLVDWTSFELMRAEHIDTAFAFDDDYVTQGFALVS
jgi:predicted nucleic acid-binding protein